MTVKVKDLITGKVTFDKFGGKYFWINEPGGGAQMLAEMRAWGHIQNMFKNKGGTINEADAGKFQDEVGDWIADAINEKLEREAKGAPAALPTAGQRSLSEMRADTLTSPALRWQWKSEAKPVDMSDPKVKQIIEETQKAIQDAIDRAKRSIRIGR